MAAPPTTTQKLLAEALGTAFLVFVGAGSAAATGVIAAGTKVPFSMAQLGMISFAFMLVIVGAVYAIGHISGGHINPAVTLSLAVSGKFPWREVPGYVAAQLVGRDRRRGRHLPHPGPGGHGRRRRRGHQLQLRPRWDSAAASLIEAIGTFMLVFVIFGVIDHRAVPGWAPMAIGVDRLRDHHHPRPGDRRGHQPGPLPGHRVHAEPGTAAPSPGLRYPPTSSASSSASRARRPCLRLSSAGCAPDPAMTSLERRCRSRTAEKSSGVSVMKMLINVPRRGHRRAGGVAAAHPCCPSTSRRGDHPGGRPEAGEGRPGIRWWVGHEPLHGGFVGYGMLDAACPARSSPRRCPTRCSPPPGSGRRRGRAAHCEELHRRRAELRDGGRTGRATRASRSSQWCSTMTWRSRQSTPRAAAAPARRSSWRRWPGAGRGGRGPGRRGGGRAGQRVGAAPSAWRSPHAWCPGGQADLRSGRGRAGARHRHPRRAGPEPGAHDPAARSPPRARRVGEDLRPAASCCVVNGMGGTPLMELTSCTTRCGSAWKFHGGQVARNLVGNYVTSLEMQGFSVTVCQLTDALTRLWDAPVDTPALRWGR